MAETQYDLAFQTAVSELVQIWGRAFVLKEFLAETKSRIDNDIVLKKVPDVFMSTGLPFRDLTKTFKLGEPNLLVPQHFYELTHSNLQEEHDMILSRECMFYIAQAYEILEEYLYDQVSEYLFLSTTVNIFIDKQTNISSKASIRKALKSLDDRQYNRHLTRIIRANSELFRTCEATNFHKLDLKDWFEMLGHVRHCITHSRMEVTDDILNKMPQIYKQYFDVISYNRNKVLFLKYEQCSQLIIGVVEYMFLVHKSFVGATFSKEVKFSDIAYLFVNPSIPK